MVERIGRLNRLVTAREHARVRAEGKAFRGAHCLVVAHVAPGEPSRVAFVASKRGVGIAVKRNRARRRLREIVRRRWARVPAEGLQLLFVAYRTSLTAPHQDLASDVEQVMTMAGALAPVETR